MLQMTDAKLMVTNTGVVETASENRTTMGLAIPTLNEISIMLDEAGIDYIQLPDEDRLYITAFVFNMWIRVHSPSSGVFLTTHWDLCDEADELEVLRTVNQLNTDFPLVQFAWDEEISRLHGHAWLSARGGPSRAVLVRTAICFAEIFKEALDMIHSAGGIKEDDKPPAIH
jgi:hypothetical protein